MHRLYRHRSGADQFDMSPGRFHHRLQVIVVGCHDVVSIIGQQYYSCVDHVGLPSAAEEQARRPSEIVVERSTAGKGEDEDTVRRCAARRPPTR
jgi:hypothetical protein